MTNAAHQPHSRTTMALAVLGALLCGAGVAAQTRVNGELSLQLGDGVLAALISFGIGMIIVTIGILLFPSGRRGLAKVRTAVANRSMPWVFLTGGTAGAFLVLSQGLVAAVLGVALFSVGVVAGQTISGILIDRRGLGSMSAKPVTALRIVGAALALVAVIYAGSSQLHADFPAWMLALPFIAGIAIAWQQAFNGQVREVSGSAVTATFVNFAVGTTLLLIAVLVHSLWAGWPTEYPTNPVLYLGGVIGVIFIALGAIVVRFIGVLLLALGSIAGQLLTALLLDVVVPAKGHELGIPTLVGTALTLVAVSLSALSTQRSGSADK